MAASTQHNNDEDGMSVWFGIVVLLTFLVGVSALLLAFDRTEHRGTCLIASAIAFGLLSNALLRK